MWIIYYIVLNMITQIEGTERDALCNLISNSMGLSLATGKTSVYLTLLCLMNFLPILYTLTKKADGFYRLRQYIVIRSNLWYFHKHVLTDALQKLGMLIAIKTVAEFLVCWNLLAFPETALTIVKINVMYSIIGLAVIGWMELLKVLIGLSFKKIFAIIAIGIVILQYFNHHGVLFDLIFTPVSILTISGFQVTFALRTTVAIMIFAALFVTIKSKEEKRGVL